MPGQSLTQNIRRRLRMTDSEGSNEVSMELPAAFISRMRNMLGEEALQSFLSSYDGERTQGLRVNPLKIAREDFLHIENFRLKPVPWEENGFSYGEPDRPGRSVLHEAGLYYIQEPSAMSAAALSGVHPGEKILDLCAAPGGKSTQLAGRMGGKGLLVSNEIHPERAKILSQNIERMGVRNAIVTNETPQNLAKRFPGFFDRILVDAPCSGEGMFRKEEQALAMWSEENVRSCALRQQEILEQADLCLKPGGTLVYSTCTFAPEEDEETIARFLAVHPGYTLVDPAGSLGEKRMEWGMDTGRAQWCAPKVHGVKIPDSVRESLVRTLRLFPHHLRGEGHFAAMLQKGGTLLAEPAGEGPADSRSGSCPAERSRDRKKRKDRMRQGAAAGAKGRPAGAASLKEAEGLWHDFAEAVLRTDIAAECVRDSASRFLLFGDELYLEPGGLDLTGLRILRPGLHLGQVLRGRFEPDHALAMTLHAADALHTFDLKQDMPQCAAYLRGESFPCDPALKGWILVTVNGYSLGWAKAAGGMLKNHYPRGLRRPY